VLRLRELRRIRSGGERETRDERPPDFASTAAERVADERSCQSPRIAEGVAEASVEAAGARLAVVRRHAAAVRGPAASEEVGRARDS
jgi:hypothetical protein